MVNRGASRGCKTCRHRKVKCDEGKPHCRECQRLGYQCEGYGRTAPRVRFKDETNRYSGNPAKRLKKDQAPSEGTSLAATPATTSIESSPSRDVRSDSSISSSPQPHHQDLAVSFFLTYVTTVGRSVESTRGFLEFCTPLFAGERQDSALIAAVDAIAIQTWERLRHPAASAPLKLSLKHKAIQRLQRAINDPDERKSDATVMAALVLQLSETLSAAHGHHKAQNTHRDGALALLMQRGDVKKHSKFYGPLLANLLHAKVSLCVRQPSAVDLKEVKWLRRLVSWIAPVNASTQLDFIGVSIASLQQSMLTGTPTTDSIAGSHPTELSDLVDTVEGQLQTWLDLVPDEWYPRRIPNDDLHSSIDLFDHACDVYLSIQIATIWNTWRIYRIILACIKLELTAVGRCSSQPHTAATDQIYFTDPTPSSPTQETQTLMSDICRSMPFYIGNRRHPTSFYDMADPDILFPSYHNLRPHDPSLLAYRTSNHYVPQTDHFRNVLLQGHLHLISILSQLIVLISGGNSGTLLAQALPPEQRAWIAEQFMRCMVLLRLSERVAEVRTVDYGDGGELQGSRVDGAGLSEVALMAQEMRERMWTMTNF